LVQHCLGTESRSEKIQQIINKRKKERKKESKQARKKKSKKESKNEKKERRNNLPTKRRTLSPCFVTKGLSTRAFTLPLKTT
jgi:hypothetical protein